MNKSFSDLIYLLTCSVNGLTPDKERIRTMNAGKIYRLSEFHMVKAAVCIALERAGVKEKHFHEAKNKHTF